MPKSKTKKAPGEHEPIDFLATGFKVTTNCAFSVKILENYKLRSDHLASGACAAAPGAGAWRGGCTGARHAGLRRPPASAPRQA